MFFQIQVLQVAFSYCSQGRFWEFDITTLTCFSVSHVSPPARGEPHVITDPSVRMPPNAAFVEESCWTFTN